MYCLQSLIRFVIRDELLLALVLVAGAMPFGYCTLRLIGLSGPLKNPKTITPKTTNRNRSHDSLP